MDPTGEECKATQDKNKIIKRKLMRSTYILFRFIKYQLYGQYIHKYFFLYKIKATYIHQSYQRIFLHFVHKKNYNSL